MNARVAAIAIVAAMCFLPAAFQESRPKSMGDVLVRVNGPLRVAAGDTASTVVVIGHDARVEGTVLQQLVVIDGTAAVTGEVLGSLVVVNGRAELGPKAYVGGDVVLHESTIERAPGARVGGVVRQRPELAWRPLVGWFFWLSATVVILAVGMVFALVAGRQAADAAYQIRTRPGPVILTAVIVVVGLPILAILSFITVIGIPLGLLIALFLIPMLAVLGYVVTAAWIGAAARRGRGDGEPAAHAAGHPYREILIGVLVLQLIGLIPLLGGLVMLAASQLGAGALVYRLWLAARRAGRV